MVTRVLGGVDYTDNTAPANDSYATRHNGFMYFKSVIGNQAYCDAHVQTIARLVPDLASAATTPDLLFRHPQHLQRRPRHPEVPER